MNNRNFRSKCKFVQSNNQGTKAMSFDFVLFLFCLTKFTCLLFNLNMYLLHKRKHTWKTIIIVNHWEATTSSVILIYEITADSINCYAVFVKKSSLDKLNIFLKTSAVKFVSLNIILKILLKGILLFPCFMFFKHSIQISYSSF